MAGKDLRWAIHVGFTTAWGTTPPWPCYFCGEPVEIDWLPQGVYSPGRLHRHHIDGDRWNNSPDNIVPSHSRCHLDYHRQPYEIIPFNGVYV